MYFDDDLKELVKLKYWEVFDVREDTLKYARSIFWESIECNVSGRN